MKRINNRDQEKKKDMYELDGGGETEGGRERT